jgi:hypothetical protein
MVLLFVLGVMNLAWVAVLTIIGLIALWATFEPWAGRWADCMGRMACYNRVTYLYLRKKMARAGSPG